MGYSTNFQIKKTVFEVLILVVLFLTFLSPLNAQQERIDAFINTHIEQIGGFEHWNTIKGIQLTQTIEQEQQDVEIQTVVLKDGRSYTKFITDSLVIMQNVFDGTTLWRTNLETFEAERIPAEETSNIIQDLSDFPSPFLFYKEKGYKIEWVGSELLDVTDVARIKVIKKPYTISSKQVANESHYLIDKKTHLILATEYTIKHGRYKGKTILTRWENYKSIDGLAFPFTIRQGFAPDLFTYNYNSIELNPIIPDSVFQFRPGFK